MEELYRSLYELAGKNLGRFKVDLENYNGKNLSYILQIKDDKKNLPNYQINFGKSGKPSINSVFKYNGSMIKGSSIDSLLKDYGGFIEVAGASPIKEGHFKQHVEERVCEKLDSSIKRLGIDHANPSYEFRPAEN